jgi:glutathione-regulated potassium-efflux system ancillary protein KefF
MRWLPPSIFHGAHQASEEIVKAHVDTYIERLRTYPHWPELNSGMTADQHSPNQ